MGVVSAPWTGVKRRSAAVSPVPDRSVPVVPIATVADHHVLVSLSGAF